MPLLPHLLACFLIAFHSFQLNLSIHLITGARGRNLEHQLPEQRRVRHELAGPDDEHLALRRHRQAQVRAQRIAGADPLRRHAGEQPHHGEHGEQGGREAGLRGRLLLHVVQAEVGRHQGEFNRDAGSAHE